YSELWFATRKFIEFGYTKAALGLPTEEIYPQFTGRRYRMSGKRSRVEEKDAYQARCNGKSPDEADAVTLLIHAVRKASGIIPGMDPSNSTESGSWDDEGEGNRSDVRIDVTNRFEDL
ncbi:hypothetical protein L0244_15445, partial [bacterium]|nr:hypothetical protein [bacterium]